MGRASGHLQLREGGRGGGGGGGGGGIFSSFLRGLLVRRWRVLACASRAPGACYVEKGWVGWVGGRGWEESNH